jgi:hypothetical protein
MASIPLFMLIVVNLYLNGMDDFSERQFGGDSVAMVDYGLSGIKVSHIQSCRKRL